MNEISYFQLPRPSYSLTSFPRNFYVCTYKYIHICVFKYMLTCGCKYIYICVYTHIYMYVYTCAKSLQSCSILCNPMDCSPPDFSVHGFSKQEYWSVLPCSPPGGIASTQESNLHLMSLVLTGIFFTTSTTWEVQYIHTYIHIYTQVCVCVYIYIYIEREREREYT